MPTTSSKQTAVSDARTRLMILAVNIEDLSDLARRDDAPKYVRNALADYAGRVREVVEMLGGPKAAEVKS